MCVGRRVGVRLGCTQVPSTARGTERDLVDSCGKTAGLSKPAVMGSSLRAGLRMLMPCPPPKPHQVQEALGQPLSLRRHQSGVCVSPRLHSALLPLPFCPQHRASPAVQWAWLGADLGRWQGSHWGQGPEWGPERQGWQCLGCG